MSGMFVLVVGLAAVFGFLLGAYLFVFRLNLALPLRWLGGIGGGLMTGFLMALAVTLLLWPPVSFLLVAGFLIGVAVLSGYILFGKARADGVEAMEGLSVAGQNQNGGSLDEDLGGYGLDLDVGTRS